MLVFGVDVPLVEVILALAIIMLLMFLEAIVIISLLIKKQSELNKLIESLKKK